MRGWALALAVPPLAFLGLFFLWPVANILALGLAPDGRLELGGVLGTWARPFVLDTVLFTLALAGLSTALTLLLGLPAAWVFARFEFPFKRAARALTVVPFVLPTVVVGSAFLALLGPRLGESDAVAPPVLDLVQRLVRKTDELFPAGAVVRLTRGADADRDGHRSRAGRHLRRLDPRANTLRGELRARTHVQP